MEAMHAASFVPSIDVQQPTEEGTAVNMHFCPICHQQFERSQHAAHHMQMCHGIILQTQVVNAVPIHPAKSYYHCNVCSGKFDSINDLDHHHRVSHKSAILARCLACGIYGVNSMIMTNSEEYKCSACGATNTTTTSQQQPYAQQGEPQNVITDEVQIVSVAEMTNDHQHHQVQNQQLGHMQRIQHGDSDQQQLQNKQKQLAALKVPPLTVKLNKGRDGTLIAYPQVVIKEESHSLSDSGDVNAAVAAAAAAANANANDCRKVSTVIVNATAENMAALKIRHKCPDCTKTFKTPGTMAMHRRIHTGEADTTPKERPFTCSYCSKSFTQSNTLKQHTRIHTGEKPFQCNFCDKSFSVKDYLTKHTRTHTGEKPYICPYCDKRFTQRSALTVHTTKLHPL